MHWVAGSNSNGVHGVQFSVKVHLRCAFGTHGLIVLLLSCSDRVGVAEFIVHTTVGEL